jgi:hypothetical protein
MQSALYETCRRKYEVLSDVLFDTLLDALFDTLLESIAKK